MDQVGEAGVSRKIRSDLVLKYHAMERWWERVNPFAKQSYIRKLIKHRLDTELRKGAKVNSRGALEVEIKPGVWAICYPSLMGGWVVATIIREGWNGDMEERARYGGESRSKLELAIEYFEDTIRESDEIMADCSADLKEELSKQKEHFVVALEAMKALKGGEGFAQNMG